MLGNVLLLVDSNKPFRCTTSNYEVRSSTVITVPVQHDSKRLGFRNFGGRGGWRRVWFALDKEKKDRRTKKWSAFLSAYISFWDQFFGQQNKESFHIFCSFYIWKSPGYIAAIAYWSERNTIATVSAFLFWLPLGIKGTMLKWGTKLAQRGITSQKQKSRTEITFV